MACKKALAPAHAQQPLQLPGRITAAPWPPTAGPVTLTHAQCPTSTSSHIFFPNYKYNCHAAPCCRRSSSNSPFVGPVQHQAYSAFLSSWGLFSCFSASSKATKKTSPLWKLTYVKLALLGTQPKHCTYVPLLLLQISVSPLNPTQKMLCGYHWGRLWPAGSDGLHSQGSGSAGSRQSWWHAGG